jgi:hypothetical protein
MSRRSQLRNAVGKATLPDKAFLVFGVLLMLMPDKDAYAVQVTWRTLQAKSNTTSSARLSGSLEHLARHGWITRTRLPGQGRPVLYGLQFGEQCECRPGRGHPMTAAERQARSRARRKEDAADVTLTRSKDVTLNGEQRHFLCHDNERDKPQVRGGVRNRGTDVSQSEPDAAATFALAKADASPPGSSIAGGAECEKTGTEDKARTGLSRTCAAAHGLRARSRKPGGCDAPRKPGRPPIPQIEQVGIAFLAEAGWPPWQMAHITGRAEMTCRKYAKRAAA